jgi:hypothetical protein
MMMCMTSLTLYLMSTEVPPDNVTQINLPSPDDVQMIPTGEDVEDGIEVAFSELPFTI